MAFRRCSRVAAQSRTAAAALDWLSCSMALAQSIVPRTSPCFAGRGVLMFGSEPGLIPAPFDTGPSSGQPSGVHVGEGSRIFP